MENSSNLKPVTKNDIIRLKINSVNSDQLVVKNDETKVENKTSELLSFLSNLVGTDKLNDLKNKVSYTLNDKTLNLIKLLVDKSPDTLKSISKSIEDILSDGKLDISDVPKLVLLVTELYNLNLKVLFAYNNFKVSDLLDLIKLIIHSIIELNIVQVDNKEKVFQILDISLSLLNTTIEVPSKLKTCCSSLYSSLYSLKRFFVCKKN
jgi:hypothetical protein